MSSIHDMISAFIAMLMSAAFLHFGATGDSHPTTPIADASHASASVMPAAERMTDSNDKALPGRTPHAPAHHLAMRSHCHGSAGAMPALDAVRAASPLRRG